MLHGRIDVSQDLDGNPVVFACFDLAEAEIAASAHAVTATVSERFRASNLSADDVLEFRELTALGDDLGEQARRPGTQTVVLRPARLSAYRDALARFVKTRHEADWIRDEDREPLASLCGLLSPLEDLCAEAMRTALTPARRL
ncbi:MAG: hypothetical protein M3131_01830 [Actinomycetota bacterium]|nr:hypothetical protein [Actinomycetota bacterium]